MFEYSFGYVKGYFNVTSHAVTCEKGRMSQDEMANGREKNLAKNGNLKNKSGSSDLKLHFKSRRGMVQKNQGDICENRE